MNNGRQADSLPPAVLSACDLEVFRGERRVCKQISFRLQAGERLEVAGENGSGKTSLLRVLSGVSANYVGELSWYGRSRGDLRECYPGEISYIAHKTGFKNDLSVRENLRFYALAKAFANGEESTGRMNVNGLGQKIEVALTRLGVGSLSNELFGVLSEGQRRRVALARLPLEASNLWLLDEPTAALDREGISICESLLAEHASRGGVAVVATHRKLEPMDGVKRLQLPPAGEGQTGRSPPGRA